MPSGGAVKGLKELQSALKAKGTAVSEGVGKAVGLAALELEAGAKAQFRQSHAPGTPTPSAPGSPPAVVSGSLRRSFHTEGPVRMGFGKYRAEVGSGLVYSRIQELGGDAGVDHTSHLPARPALAPAYEEWRDKDVLWNRAREAVIEGLKA